MEWVISTDPYNEAWRRILEYANYDFVETQLAKLHGKASNSSIKDNYKKQALQIRVCLLQAQEYFSASAHASIFTSFNHLYYGSVALTTAVMLLRGTGDQALDRLRQNSSNANHGLIFSNNLTAKTSSKDKILLANSYVEVARYGHFINWYTQYPNSDPSICTKKVHLENIHTTTRAVGGYQELKRPDKVIGNKWTLLELLQNVPDLYSDFSRHGLNIPGSRCTYEITETEEEYIYKWTMHSAKNKESLEQILSTFEISPEWVNDFNLELDTHDKSTGAIVTLSYKKNPPANRSKARFRFPSLRESLDGELFAFGKELDFPELAEVHLALFGLSMLSRYYPDLWISCLESHCRSAVILNRAVFTLRQRLPLLALRALQNSTILISPHKPNWY